MTTNLSKAVLLVLRAINLSSLLYVFIQNNLSSSVITFSKRRNFVCMNQHMFLNSMADISAQTHQLIRKGKTISNLLEWNLLFRKLH